MGKLINIDNGGTLTDICVIDGARVVHAKTLTTPHDLSRCFIDGLSKVADLIYGKEGKLDELLLSTDHIRYSTTQGTNAIVERKGPRLGLIVSTGSILSGLRRDGGENGLFEALVADRIVEFKLGAAEDTTLESRLVAAVTRLAAIGANRIVVGFDGPDYQGHEAIFKDLALRKFPRHLLGVVPILCAGDLVDDPEPLRRIWSALLNAFLHPVMESFLYNAEGILREHYHRHPLLIFRNDGDSARVARTVAIKTYSSGPRGGMEGARALAEHYGCEHLLSLDIGGTTADIGWVEKGHVRIHERGQIEGMAISLPLCDVVSVGVGGSSIIRVVEGRIVVGPESTGAAPGPACFGLGGQLATITDVFLLTGLIDPASYFGGAMSLNRERARLAVETHIAQPMGLTLHAALAAAERAWGSKVANSLRRHVGGEIPGDTTLAAFGGAGPFIITSIADAAGIRRAIIPGLAAVFSAFGIGFSDIGQNYEASLASLDAAAVAVVTGTLLASARRDMFAEGFNLDECELHWNLVLTGADPHSEHPWAPGLPLPSGAHAGQAVLRLRAVRVIHHAHIDSGAGTTSPAAVSTATRTLDVPGLGEVSLPVYRIEEQPAGASGEGPCILEEAYFTGRIDAGWRFEIRANRDSVLTRIV